MDSAHRGTVGLLLMAMLVVASCSRTPPVARAGARATDSGHRASDSSAWLLAPEPGNDLIHADATETSLRGEFGEAAVRSDSVYVGEGMSELGTLLFPDDSTRRLAIVWEDTVARARPAYVYVSGGKTVWQLYPGVGIGTDLKTLERLNGRPFELSGFAWDYSGTTGSFNKGRLDTLWSRNGALGDAALLRLDPQAAGAPDSLTAQVVGDRSFSSDHPAMQRLNPRIYQILVRPR